MRREDRQVKEINEIKDIIDHTMILHLGLFDGTYPYIVPLHYGYVYEDRFVFYMHCANEGHKLDLIQENPHVCIELENDMEIVSGGDVPCKYGATFASVIGRGKAEIVEDVDEKIKGLKCLMKHQTGRDFELNEQMANAVTVIKVTVEELTAKARKK